MNAHQSLKQSVGRTLLAQVFNNDQLIDLKKISSSVNAGTKLDGDTRPTFDTNLKTISNDGLYTKSTQAVFPILQAEQIARSFAVVNNLLDAKSEFDSSITFETTNPALPTQISFIELIEIPHLVYLIDIIDNTGTTIKLSTYDRDLTVTNGFYGNPSITTSTYISNTDIIGLDSTGNSIRDGIRDGIPGDGLQLAANTAGLTNMIQSHKHINGKIKLRAVGVKEGVILFGPVRLANLAIDGAQQSLNTNSESSIITLSTIKNWDQIKNQYGARTADAVHLSRFPTDGFFKHASSISFTKLWKEKE